MQNLKVFVTGLLLVYFIPLYSFQTNTTQEQALLDSISSLFRKTTINIYDFDDPELILNDIQNLLQAGEDSSNEYIKANAYLYYGELSILTYDYEVAKEHIDKAIVLFKKKGYFNKVIVCHKLLSIIYRNRGEYDSIKKVLDKSIAISKKVKDFHILYALHEMTVFYDHDLNKYKTAIQYGEQFFKSLDSLNQFEIEDVDFIAMRDELSLIIDLALARAYFGTNQLEKVLPHLEKAESFFIKDTDDSKLYRVYKIFINYYEKKQNHDKVLKYQELLMRANKNQKKKLHQRLLQIPRLKNKMLSLKNEANLYKLENEKNIQLSKKSTTITLLILLTLIIICLFTLVYYKKNKKNKQLNSLLSKKNNQLIQHTEDKLRFFSIISHELRTPLYAVVGISNLLSTGKNTNTENIHEDLDTLKFSGEQLLFLINNILNVNKIQQEKLSISNNHFNLEELLSNLVKSLSFMAEKNKKTVHLEMDIKNKNLIGDYKKLYEILGNLLDNAIKFSNKNVWIIVKQDENHIASSKFSFSIKDDGSGIPKKTQEHIYDFSKKKHLDKYNGGSGIGLYIIKNLVDVMHSKINLTSSKDKGTTFQFSLQFETKKEEIISKEILTIGFSKNILVIDDNKINLVVSQKIINSFGCKAFVASNHFTALKIIEKENVDVILMDINMPDVDGYQLTKTIRKKHNIPIIAHTAMTKEDISSQFLASGMDDLIVKPYHPDELFSKINDVIKKKGLTKTNTN